MIEAEGRPAGSGATLAQGRGLPRGLCRFVYSHGAADSAWRAWPLNPLRGAPRRDWRALFPLHVHHLRSTLCRDGGSSPVCCCGSLAALLSRRKLSGDLSKVKSLRGDCQDSRPTLGAVRGRCRGTRRRHDHGGGCGCRGLTPVLLPAVPVGDARRRPYPFNTSGRSSRS